MSRASGFKLSGVTCWFLGGKKGGKVEAGLKLSNSVKSVPKLRHTSTGDNRIKAPENVLIKSFVQFCAPSNLIASSRCQSVRVDFKSTSGHSIAIWSPKLDFSLLRSKMFFLVRFGWENAENFPIC